MNVLHRSVPLTVLLLVLILLGVFHSLPMHSSGFLVRIAPERCNVLTPDRPIVLHMSREGALFLSSDLVVRNDIEGFERNNLARVLSAIYRTRAERLLYLIADDDVPFEAVADVLDITQNVYVDAIEVPGTPSELRGGRWKLDITVSLVMPRAKCPPPIIFHSDPHR